MAIDRTRHERINIRNCARMLISPKKSRFLLWRAARACSLIALRTSAEVCRTQTKATFFRSCSNNRSIPRLFKPWTNSQSPREKTLDTNSLGQGSVGSPSLDPGTASGNCRDPIHPFVATAINIRTRSTPAIRLKKSIMSAPSFVDNHASLEAVAAFRPRSFDTHRRGPRDCSSAADLADMTTNTRATNLVLLYRMPNTHRTRNYDFVRKQRSGI